MVTGVPSLESLLGVVAPRIGHEQPFHIYWSNTASVSAARHPEFIDKFVPDEEIDKRFYERPYYVVPDDKSGEETFAVIRSAMRDKGRVALASYSLIDTF